MRCVRKGIEPIELISSTSETRAAAGSLNMLLSYLADPQSGEEVGECVSGVAEGIWREGGGPKTEDEEEIASSQRALLAMTTTFVAQDG